MWYVYGLSSKGTEILFLSAPILGNNTCEILILCVFMCLGVPAGSHTEECGMADTLSKPLVLSDLDCYHGSTSRLQVSSDYFSC